jgi:LuxR family quorum sensing-dependent transcriptional regulator
LIHAKSHSRNELIVEVLVTFPMDKTWRFFRDIDGAADKQAIEKVLLDITRPLGIALIGGGLVPTLRASMRDIRKRMLLQRFPGEWADRYNGRGYVNRDPVVERLQVDRAPFTWKDAYSSSAHAHNVALIDGEAREFGLRGGFVVPVTLLDGGVAAISFGGAERDFSPEDRSLLVFLANCAVGAILQRRFHSCLSHDVLSPREHECLLWAADGKTDWEIARILGISKPTVTKHVLSVRVKLGAASKAHAIAVALRRKIIS